VVEIGEPVDEAKLIEERRKKREAIKAKYRGPGTPLLATALGVKETPAGSPADSTDIDSPSMSILTDKFMYLVNVNL
jgi:serine/threonine-protein kinase PRP4